MANISGKAAAITVITPMKWWKSYFLRLLFRMIKWGFFAKVQEHLIQLSFIHFAHWSIVKRGQFPRLSDDQPPDYTKYDYLVFVSNFNGSWDQYIDAFTEVIPMGMDNIRKWSEGFPGSVPEGPFFEYIKHNQFAAAYYYNATPGAGATDITSALKVNEELYEFEKSSRDMSPVEFEQAYQKFMIKVQNHLGETGLTEWERISAEGDIGAAELATAGGAK